MTEKKTLQSLRNHNSKKLQNKKVNKLLKDIPTDNISKQ